MPKRAKPYFGSQFSQVHPAAMTAFMLDKKLYVAHYSKDITKFKGYYAIYTALYGYGWEYEWRYSEPPGLGTNTEGMWANVPGALVSVIKTTPQPPAPKPHPGMLPLKILNRTLIGSLVFLKGDTGPKVYTGAGNIPSKEKFEKWVRGAMYDPAMPDPDKEPERALEWLLNKANRVGLGKMTVQEQELLKSLKDKLESLSGIEGLAKWALQIRADPEIPSKKSTVWITWVFNNDGNSMGQYESFKKPYLRNSNKDMHAEEGFRNNFERLKGDYQKYCRKQGKDATVHQVELLIKRSPCADPKNSKHHCVNLLLELQKKYPRIKFIVYYMDLYYGVGNNQMENSIEGINILNSRNIKNKPFIEVLSRSNKNWNEINKYTEEIQKE